MCPTPLLEPVETKQLNHSIKRFCSAAGVQQYFRYIKRNASSVALMLPLSSHRSSTYWTKQTLSWVDGVMFLSPLFYPRRLCHFRIRFFCKSCKRHYLSTPWQMLTTPYWIVMLLIVTDHNQIVLCAFFCMKISRSDHSFWGFWLSLLWARSYHYLSRCCLDNDVVRAKKKRLAVSQFQIQAVFCEFAAVLLAAARELPTHL